MTLRVGKIEYANCIPLFRALESMGDLQCCFIDGVPSRLNVLLSSGGVDLSPSSSILYASDPARYLILPGLSISAAGPVRSVLLFSRSRIETIDGKIIGLTSESDTSVALLKIILSKFYGFQNSFVRTDQMPDSVVDSIGGLLLIGDNALRESAKASGMYVYDLGELWYRFTGLPFVYALWLVNRHSTAGRESQVADLAARLINAKLVSRNNLFSYVEGSNLEWYGADNLVAYWKTISYDLGKAEIEGLSCFYRSAAELGIIEADPALSFMPEYSLPGAVDDAD